MVTAALVGLSVPNESGERASPDLQLRGTEIDPPETGRLSPRAHAPPAPHLAEVCCTGMYSSPEKLGRIRDVDFCGLPFLEFLDKEEAARARNCHIRVVVVVLLLSQSQLPKLE